MLIDNYGRPWLKLRIVVNSVCNYRCIFCHFEGQGKFLSRELSAEDIGFVTSVAKDLGVDDFKITGGEPLLRKDIVKVVDEISRIGPKDLSLTTNGYFLDIYAEDLLSHGLRRLNISLHSLDRRKYSFITGVDALNKVLENIDYVSKLGFRQIKLNVVALRGLNTNEIPMMIRFAAKYGFVLQLIELMPMGEGFPVFARYYDDLSDIINWLNKHGKLLGTRKDLHNRPLYEVDGVRVEIVKNYNNPTFCAGCTTMRLTSDGKLKTCLYKEPVVDLWPYIRTRDREGLMKAMIYANSLRKPNFVEGSSGDLSRIRIKVRIGNLVY
ncbi:putative molybdenum cofactor biosynthesis protein A [Vulcanisaeta moutnovskia 768-28]|uniref:Probable GTP 3',8-cyclase n=1 Tax=Vulcanisaeta moutnovskia (strain 768-28) TaxID=985053 RepID=F0QUA2_VULM7|nr:GTP 3',8-cyclase MoaA [Vulcanisaeta moutnovskia]ADY00642.1 putative molybdenum cofactor biosynthesis protein A [Vulcanisaeta moutnovskia 768-28]